MAITSRYLLNTETTSTTRKKKTESARIASCCGRGANSVPTSREREKEREGDGKKKNKTTSNIHVVIVKVIPSYIENAREGKQLESRERRIRSRAHQHPEPEQCSQRRHTTYKQNIRTHQSRTRNSQCRSASDSRRSPFLPD